MLLFVVALLLLLLCHVLVILIIHLLYLLYNIEPIYDINVDVLQKEAHWLQSTVIGVVNLILVVFKKLFEELNSFLSVLKDDEPVSNTEICKVHPHLVAIHMLIFHVNYFTCIWLIEHSVPFQDFKETNKVSLLRKCRIMTVKSE